MPDSFKLNDNFYSDIYPNFRIKRINIAIIFIAFALVAILFHSFDAISALHLNRQESTEIASPNYLPETFVGSDEPNGYYAYGDEDHWVMLIIMGQSNAVGSANEDHPDDPRYGTRPLYPDNAFMFSGGVHRFGSSLGDRTLVPLVESKSGSSTAASSWATHLIRDLDTKVGRKPKILAFVSAIGATDLNLLSRGGLPDSYKAMLQGVDDGVAAIRARGGKRVTVVVSFRQGEGEVAVSPYQRKAALRVLFRSLRADIGERTQEREPVLILVSQVASIRFLAKAEDVPYTNSASQNYSHLWNNQYGRLVPLEMERNGEVLLSGPLYPYPQVIGKTQDYRIHLSNSGQNYVGQMEARATLDELFGQGWRGLRLMPETLRWTNATTLKIDADTPGQLVLDTSNRTVSTDGLVNGTGIEAYSEGFAMPKFTASVSDRTLTLAFSDPPAGPFKLGIAVGTNAHPNMDGPITGARSILRANVGHRNAYDNSLHYDWCPATIMNVPAGPRRM